MIDFTGLPKKNKAYSGANGSKISVIYCGEQYMLKFPPLPGKNKEMSYTNSCYSEYIGCQIFKSVGISVQETLLGTYTVRDKQKVVVACRDFTTPGIVLQDFASLKNQMIDSARNGYGTELDDILMTIDGQVAIDRQELSERFWDMFIIDALIGNWDRHNGNWGFLYNTNDDSLVLAPVYDCGSSLYPQADEELMKKILASKDEINYRVFQIPTSSILINGKRINYYNFISSMEKEECNSAIRRIVPRINMDAISDIINNTPYTTELQKEFYITMLSERKKRILDFVYEKL